ncbi:Slit And Ntrk-Like Protein 1, partial [Manis pentadactyla]
SVGWLCTPALPARSQGAEREAGRAHGLREKTNLTTTVPGRGTGREVRQDPEAEFSGHPETGVAANVGRASGRQRPAGAVRTERRRPGDRAPGPAGCAQPGTGDCGRCGLRGVGRNAGGGAFAPGPPPPLLKTARAPSCSTRSSRPGAAAALPPAWTSRLTSRRISSPHLSSARNGPQLLLLHW